jgi:hypothetical protein
MDIQQRVQILIGGDATQAKKVIKEVENEMRASQVRQRSTAAKAGSEVGESYGRAFNRAQDRWLKTAEDGFRRYGGRVGGIIANVIGMYDKFDKSVKSTRELGSQSAQSAAAKGAVGNNISTAELVASSVIGSSLSMGKHKKIVGVRRSSFKPLQTINGFAVLPMSVAEQELFSRAMYAQDAMSPAELSAYDILKQNQLKGNKRMRVRQPSIARQARKAVKKIPVLGMDIAPVARFVGGTAGALVGGTAAAVMGVVMAFKALGSVYDVIIEKEKRYASNKDLIDSIEKLGNTTDKTREILKQFGKDGLEAYRKLQEEQIKLGREVEDDKKWRSMSLNAKITTDAISGWFGKLWGGIKYGAASSFNFFAKAFGVSKEIGDQIAEREADITRMQRLADKQKVDRVQKEDEDKKAKEELDDLRWKEKADELKENELKIAVDLLKLKKDQSKEIKDQLNYEKAKAELDALVEKRSEKEREAKERIATAAERAADAAEREVEAKKRELTRDYEESVRNQRTIEDKSRYTISDLADTNSVAGNAAKNIQSLEGQAKQARLNGNHRLAERLIGQANTIRGQLGAAGITQSGEYGEDFPLAKSAPTRALTPAERMQEALMMSPGILKYGDRAGYGALKVKGLSRLSEMQSGKKPVKTLDEYLAENGYIPVKPKNGK